jgi:hypothetical protein
MLPPWGDDPGIWLEQLRKRGKDGHLFQPSDFQCAQKERQEFFGYTRAEFDLLPAEKRLGLANQELAKKQKAKEEARRRFG